MGETIKKQWRFAIKDKTLYLFANNPCPAITKSLTKLNTQIQT